MKVISTTKAPAAIGPYSQAIKVGNLVYTSGQIPIDPATGVFVEGGIKEQTRQSLTNIKAILEEAGLTLSNVVKTTVFLADMNDFADMNAVYAEFFTKPYPARSAVAKRGLSNRLFCLKTARKPCVFWRFFSKYHSCGMRMP